MLISHDLKFIYIKPEKVAGSSVQAFLSTISKKGVEYKRDPMSHICASEVRTMVGDVVWDNYLLVTSTRNPWDKVVSLYYWRRRKKPFFTKILRFFKGMTITSPAENMSFREFVWYLHRRGELNMDKEIIFIENQLPDYHFIRFEKMDEDLKALTNMLGVTYDRNKVPRKKSGYRNVSDYSELYDGETRELVRVAYTDEIKRFG